MSHKSKSIKCLVVIITLFLGSYYVIADDNLTDQAFESKKMDYFTALNQQINDAVSNGKVDLKNLFKNGLIKWEGECYERDLNLGVLVFEASAKITEEIIRQRQSFGKPPVFDKIEVGDPFSYSFSIDTNNLGASISVNGPYLVQIEEQDVLLYKEELSFSWDDSVVLERACYLIMTPILFK